MTDEHDDVAESACPTPGLPNGTSRSADTAQSRAIIATKAERLPTAEPAKCWRS